MLTLLIQLNLDNSFAVSLKLAKSSEKVFNYSLLCEQHNLRQ